MSNIYEKLLEIQLELKVPKNQRNTFGNYNFRSCEDILENAKPVCTKHKTVLFVKDELVMVGNRYYIKATAELRDVEDATQTITVESLAREEETKKGMDASQITGAASSYARKYALNGLFCLDDNKDADNDGYPKSDDKTGNTPYIPGNQSSIPKTISDAQIKLFSGKAKNKMELATAILKKYGYTNSKDILAKDFNNMLKELGE